jgi:DNA-binding transcriptional LysR family regulator
MEFHQLRSFCEIARERSFTRAAARLGLTQPAISLQMKALEEELGEPLLVRHRTQLRLTPAGELLYQHAQAVLASLEAARADITAFRQGLRGHVALATSDTNSTYILPEVLRQFRECYPQVRIDIRDKMSSQVLQLVVDHEVDFGLATLPLLPPPVTTEVLFRREDVVICPRGSPLAQESGVSLAQVSPYPLLALSRRSMSRQLLEAAFQQAGAPMQVAMNLGSIEVIKRFVAIGLGFAIVPRVAVLDEVRTGQVVAIPVYGLPIREIGLVERMRKRRSTAATAFLQLLRAYITHRPLESADACVDT